MGVRIQLFEVGAYRPYSFRFLSVVWMKSEVYKETVNTRDELVVPIMNSAALIKQERQDDLKRATRTIAKGVESALKSMVGFLNPYEYFELLKFIEIIYITNKSSQ